MAITDDDAFRAANASPRAVASPIIGMIAASSFSNRLGNYLDSDNGNETVDEMAALNVARPTEA